MPVPGLRSFGPTSKPGSSACTTNPEMPLAGYPAPLLEFMFDTTRSIVDLVLSGVLDRHPDLRVIVPHAGAALSVLVNRIDLLTPLAMKADGRPLPSVRAAMRQLHFDLAGAPVEEQLRALLGVTPAENIHYGSDFPFTPEQACLALATHLKTTQVLDDAARERMFWDNSVELFPRLGRNNRESTNQH
jgi:predicted TIM-barrel fold metal-dependent hydrolase